MADSPIFQLEENLYCKDETVHPSASYKMRGVRRLLDHSIPAEGYSTVSAGNLGRALAIACRERGIPCKIFLPSTAPLLKKEKLAQLGAEIIELPFEKIWELVSNPHREPGFVHPVLEQKLLDGYGEISAEIERQLPQVTSIVVPFGLGGLALGAAERMNALRPEVKIFAAELDHTAPLFAALSLGSPIRVPTAASFVDAIGTPEVLPFVYPRVEKCVSGSVRVSLAEVRRAMLELHDSHGIVVEGAAAAALAAAKKLRGTTVAVLSGGNIAPEVHKREVNFSNLSAINFRNAEAL